MDWSLAVMSNLDMGARELSGGCLLQTVAELTSNKQTLTHVTLLTVFAHVIDTTNASKGGMLGVVNWKS